MFSKFINTLIIIICLLTFGFVTYTAIAPFTPHKFVYQGVVDDEGFYEDIQSLNLQNTFVVWGKSNTDFGKKLDSIIEKKRMPVITIEPWGLVDGEEYNFDNLPEISI